jgi:hypothetical protein
MRMKAQGYEVAMDGKLIYCRGFFVSLADAGKVSIVEGLVSGVSGQVPMDGKLIYCLVGDKPTIEGW